jgi:hypothetical protein
MQLNLNILNTKEPIDYFKLIDDPNFYALSFVRQSVDFQNHRHNGTDFDVETVFIRHRLTESVMTRLCYAQADQNLIPMAISLTVRENDNIPPQTNTFSFIDISKAIVSHRSMKVSLGAFIKQRTTWGSVLQFLDKLRSAAAVLHAAKLGIEPDEIFKHYNVTVNIEDVDGYQTRTLEVHDPFSEYGYAVPHRIFNVQLTAIS